MYVTLSMEGRSTHGSIQLQTGPRRHQETQQKCEISFQSCVRPDERFFPVVNDHSFTLPEFMGRQSQWLFSGADIEGFEIGCEKKGNVIARLMPGTPRQRQEPKKEGATAQHKFLPYRLYRRLSVILILPTSLYNHHNPQRWAPGATLSISPTMILR